ncbi:hypothetical protein QJS10_CPA01g01117 [Acorus calamus]|uniref:Uncharacterized protein n=1 Tax=Acorus calamus TaxID=4465 RepID=A0AAV9FH39_ACOCL|nr:hypothetical protein QJS10_CPA01g01117 [Acorus calamus]
MSSLSSDPNSTVFLASNSKLNNIQEGGILVQNCGDSDIERAVIEAAKERKLQTINIPGTRRRPRS